MSAGLSRAVGSTRTLLRCTIDSKLASSVSAASLSAASTSTSPAQPFQLCHSFVAGYHDQEVPFGFNGLGELVYLRTYARIKEGPAGGVGGGVRREVWWETVERVVNGTFSMQKRWMEASCLGWDEARAQTEAQDMYERIFTMKFLPPGRGLWAMGTSITEDRQLYAALNNCAFISTEGLSKDPAGPFCFLMDASMLGVGVGFDTKGAEMASPSPLLVTGCDQQEVGGSEKRKRDQRVTKQGRNRNTSVSDFPYYLYLYLSHTLMLTPPPSIHGEGPIGAP